LRRIEREPSTMQSISREPRTPDQFGGSISSIGQPWRKNLGEDGRELTKEGSTKSPLEIEISREEKLKSPWRGPWNREFFVGERDTKCGTILERESHGPFYRPVVPV
jgi:hypothetical protein